MILHVQKLHALHNIILVLYTILTTIINTSLICLSIQTEKYVFFKIFIFFNIIVEIDINILNKHSNRKYEI